MTAPLVDPGKSRLCYLVGHPVMAGVCLRCGQVMNIDKPKEDAPVTAPLVDVSAAHAAVLAVAGEIVRGQWIAGDEAWTDEVDRKRIEWARRVKAAADLIPSEHDLRVALAVSLNNDETLRMAIGDALYANDGNSGGQRTTAALTAITNHLTGDNPMSAPVATNEPSLVAALSEFLDCYACPDCHAPGDPHGLSNDDVQHISRAFRTAIAASLNNDEALPLLMLTAYGRRFYGDTWAEQVEAKAHMPGQDQILAMAAALTAITEHLTGDTP